MMSLCYRFGSRHSRAGTALLIAETRALSPHHVCVLRNSSESTTGKVPFSFGGVGWLQGGALSGACSNQGQPCAGPSP